MYNKNCIQICKVGKSIKQYRIFLKLELLQYLNIYFKF